MPGTGDIVQRAIFALVLLAPTTVDAAGVPLRTPGQKIVKAPDPKEIKAPDPKEIKAPDPKEIKAPEPKEIKAPEPKEIKAPDPKEIKAPEPKEIVNHWEDHGGVHDQRLRPDGSVTTIDHMSDGSVVKSESKLVDPQKHLYETKVITTDRETELGGFGKTEERLYKANGAEIVTTTERGRFRDDVTIVTTANGRVTTQATTDLGLKVVSMSMKTTTIVENGQTETIRQGTVGASIYVASGELTAVGGGDLSKHGQIGLGGKVETLRGFGPGAELTGSLGAGKTGVTAEGKLLGVKVNGTVVTEKDPITDARTHELSVEGGAPKALGGASLKLGATAGKLADESRVELGHHASLDLSAGQPKKAGLRVGVGERTVYGQGTQLGAFGGVTRELGEGTAEAGGGVIYDSRDGSFGLRSYQGAKDIVGSTMPDFSKDGIPNGTPKD